MLKRVPNEKDQAPVLLFAHTADVLELTCACARMHPECGTDVEWVLDYLDIHNEAAHDLSYR